MKEKGKQIRDLENEIIILKSKLQEAQNSHKAVINQLSDEVEKVKSLKTLKIKLEGKLFKLKDFIKIL